MKRNCRKILAILIFFSILFQNSAIKGILIVSASGNIENTIATAALEEADLTASHEDITENSPNEDENNEEGSTEDIEEDITEEENEECLYTAADFVNYAYNCTTLTALDAVDQIKVDTDKTTATGNILILGNEGEELSGELAQREISTIYKGSQLPVTIKLEYIDDISTLTNPLTEYDIILLEESSEDIGLTNQQFLALSQLSNITILYTPKLLYKYHTSDGGFHFDDTTGTLLINTTQAFIGTEKYYTGTHTMEQTKTFKQVDKNMVKEIKYLPTYPSDSIDLGYAESSLAVNTKAEKIVLPDRIKNLKSGFLELVTLQTINLEHVVAIAANVFEGCTSLEEVDLSSALSIGQAAFKGDSNLEITDFHADAQLSMFSFENACKGTLRLPENLEAVPAQCFKNSHITEIQFGTKVTEIRAGAFQSTGFLTEVTIPEHITKIGEGAFRYSSLQFINLHAGSGDVSIKSQAFSDCQNLIHVNFQLRDRKSSITLSSRAFSNPAEEAAYKVICLINNSKNQLFSGACINPEKDCLIKPHFGDGGAFIKYVGMVSLDANGGNVGDVAVLYDGVYNHLPVPDRSGYRFLGWYDGDVQVKDGDGISLQGDITLVAKWEKNAGGDILSGGDADEIHVIGANHSGVTSWETLSNTPIYYQNYKLESSFQYGGGYDDVYYSQINNFSRTDKVNADKLFNQVYNTSSAYTEVVLNPKESTLDATEYKKYKIINTGLDTDSFIRAITLMNVIYFQNLSYMHRIQNDFLTKKDKAVISYSDLLAGITPDNSTTLWRTEDVKNSYDEYDVNDFEGRKIEDGELHYEIKLKIFQEYYERCRELDRKLDAVAVAIGLDQNTTNITVSDAVIRINSYIYDNFAYDHFYKSWDLYWFFQPDNPQSHDMAELLKYYHNNEGDKKRNYHGICQSYAFFACALFAKYGYAMPGYVDEGVTHMFNQLFINGRSLYVDYCWNADMSQKRDNTEYLYMSYDELNVLSNHRNSHVDSLFQTTIQFNVQYPKASLKRGNITKVTNKSGKKVVIKYKKITNAEKYHIQYSENKNFSKAKSVRAKGNKVTIKNLKINKTYYFRVRAYKSTTYIKSIKLYGKWSKTMKLKVRK